MPDKFSYDERQRMSRLEELETDELAEKIVTLERQVAAAETKVSVLTHHDTCWLSSPYYKKMHTALYNLVRHFDSDFENPGLEIYGLVGGKELCPGGVYLNKCLDDARVIFVDAIKAAAVPPGEQTCGACGHNTPCTGVTDGNGTPVSGVLCKLNAGSFLLAKWKCDDWTPKPKERTEEVTRWRR